MSDINPPPTPMLPKSVIPSSRFVIPSNARDLLFSCLLRAELWRVGSRSRGISLLLRQGMAIPGTPISRLAV